MKQESFLKRGELAQKAGVGFEAVRFYENKKLIPPPERSASGNRKAMRQECLT